MASTIASVALVCALCSPSEQTVLNVIQEDGVTDKNAAAVILANIKQESNFNPLACEGFYPALANSYEHCYNNTRGGFGLLQWTSEARIKGLGTFCATYNCDPSTVAGQMRYLVNEYDYTLVRPVFTTPGLPLQEYKDAAFAWIRWGITGHRWTYANEYINKINEVQRPVEEAQEKKWIHRQAKRGGLQLG